MNNNYDVIVVGAGNSGLISALSLINDGKKVLLLDDHNQIGGQSPCTLKGRFEFLTSFQQLYLNKNSDEKYKLSNIIKRCGTTEDIEWSPVEGLFRIITPTKDIFMPTGIENYIEAIEKYVPGSRNSVTDFINLALECREALDYIYKKSDNIDYDYIKSEYNNFMHVSDYTLSIVLDSLGIPVEAQEIINALWIYLGSSETELSFITYAVFLINLIEYGIKVPTYGNYDIASFIANNFLERGGKIRLNSKVVKLIIDDNKINGVTLEDGTNYYCDKVIINSSMSNVYNKLLNHKEVPKQALKALNVREHGAKVLTINLGLNRSNIELGLQNYMYLIYQSLDTDVLYNSMRDKNHKNIIAYVHNNANKYASPDGTCLISLYAVYFSDCFGSILNTENYFNEIHMMANSIIKNFENSTGVKISNYIEEIEIKSPLSLAAITDSPEGNSYGYTLSKNDDLLPRMLNKNNESYIEGLEICNGFDCDAYGYASSFMSGIDSAIAIQKERRR